MKLLKIDERGYYIEDFITNEVPKIIEIQTDENNNPIEVEIPNPLYITVPCPNGFYKPKWNGTEWVEGLTQAEIDEIKNRPTEPTENEMLRDYVLELDYRLITMELGI